MKYPPLFMTFVTRTIRLFDSSRVQEHPAQFMNKTRTATATVMQNKGDTKQCLAHDGLHAAAVGGVDLENKGSDRGRVSSVKSIHGFVVLNDQDRHFGQLYKLGLNVLDPTTLVGPFMTDPRVSCVIDCFRIVEKPNLQNFIEYGTKIAIVTTAGLADKVDAAVAAGKMQVPPTLHVIKDPKNDSWRSNALIVLDIFDMLDPVNIKKWGLPTTKPLLQYYETKREMRRHALEMGLTQTQEMLRSLESLVSLLSKVESHRSMPKAEAKRPMQADLEQMALVVPSLSNLLSTVSKTLAEMSVKLEDTSKKLLLSTPAPKATSLQASFLQAGDEDWQTVSKDPAFRAPVRQMTGLLL
jgi:hypothetical protein